MRLLNGDCVRVKELAALIAVGDDSVVSADERVFFQAHIESCMDCAEFFAELQVDLKGILVGLKNMPEPELPEFFHEEVMGKIRKEVARGKMKPVTRMNRIYRNFGTVAATLAALVVVSVAVIGFSGGLDRFGFGTDYHFAPDVDDIERLMNDEVLNEAGIQGFEFIAEAHSDIWGSGMPEVAEQLPQGITRNLYPEAEMAPPMGESPMNAGAVMPPLATSVPVSPAVGGICDEDDFATWFDFVVTVDDLSAALEAMRGIGTTLLEAENYCRASIAMQVTAEEFDVVLATLARLGEIEYVITPEFTEINILFQLKDR